MPAPQPDPVTAFVTHLRATFPGVYVGDTLTSDRPFIQVDLLPGGTVVKRGYVDRIRLDLVCYGNAARQGRALAADVRAASLGGFVTPKARVLAVVASPPFAIPDGFTNETAWRVPVTCLLVSRAS